jgi:hypothetical protein
MTATWIRSESGRSSKVVKLSNSWLCVYFDKEELTSNLNQEFKTKKEALRSGQYWVDTYLID